MSEAPAESHGASPQSELEFQPDHIRGEIDGLSQDQLIDLIKGERLKRKEAEKLALYDVTGVYSKKAFFDRSNANHERSKRSGSPYAILFIDMGNFKQLNDSLGHGIGDNVLGAVGSTLGNSFRAEDIVGRVGGDEFAVTLVDYSGEGETLEQTRQRLQAKLNDSVTQFAQQTNIDLNSTGIYMDVGFAEYRGQETFEEVMKAADDNMYEEKRRRKGNVR